MQVILIFKHMRLFISTAAMLILLYSLSGCTASQVECPPDNQPFVVHKNPKKGFPVYVSESRAEINATLDALEQLRQRQLNSATLVELTQLQSTLAGISENFETTTRPAYMSYHRNPCEANIDYFKIMHEIAQVRELGAEFSRMAETEGNPDEARILEVIDTYRSGSEKEGIQSL